MKNDLQSKHIFNQFKHFGIGFEHDYFLENLSGLLASGMPITDAIFAVQSEIKSKRLRKIIDSINQDIQAGFSLADALERTGIFSSHVASLIRIGESSGKLTENLKILAVEQSKERGLRSKLKSAIMYPGFVLSLTVIVGTGIAWFILPKLAIVFSQLKLTLPLITKIVIGLGLFLSAYGLYAIPAFFIFLLLLFYFLFSFSKTRFIGEWILFLIPGVKVLFKETELARFGYLFGTLLSAGLSPVEAVHSLGQATSLGRYKKFYRYLADSITDGDSFKKIFTKYKKVNKLFPASIQQLIVAGEQSGSLPSTLIKIGQDYEAKTDTTAKDLTIILEPILLVIVWLGVLAVAFAVILPIYSLIGGLNTDPNQSSSPPPQAQTIETSTPTTADNTVMTPTVLPKLKILPTSLDYLNVRTEPSINGKTIDTVIPGEIYEYSDYQTGWYKIIIPNKESGWVTEKYVQLQAQN